MTGKVAPPAVSTQQGPRGIRFDFNEGARVALPPGDGRCACPISTPAAFCSRAKTGGFTHPTNEFATPYRVINYHACNSCWNDPRLRFDNQDYLWCPRLAGTPRQFECTRLYEAPTS